MTTSIQRTTITLDTPTPIDTRGTIGGLVITRHVVDVTLEDFTSRQPKPKKF